MIVGSHYTEETILTQSCWWWRTVLHHINVDAIRSRFIPYAASVFDLATLSNINELDLESIQRIACMGS